MQSKPEHIDLWFSETHDSHTKYSFRVKETLFHEISEFQTVDVIDTAAFGKVLLIDGLVMITEQDEFVYHEMISHIPALLHAAPRNAVVIGGGDGGTVRELLKHPSIEKVILCEIDEVVVNASKKFFPTVAGKLTDPRVEVKIGDGIDYVAKLNPESVDLILVDSTDPFGPGEGLFSSEFYRNVAKALTPDGLMACQSESPWYPAPELQRVFRNVGAGFEHVYPYLGSVPTYPRSLWSWTLGAKKKVTLDFSNESRWMALEEEKPLDYLNPELAKAAFALPNFYKRKFKASDEPI